MEAKEEKTLVNASNLVFLWTLTYLKYLNKVIKVIAVFTDLINW